MNVFFKNKDFQKLVLNSLLSTMGDSLYYIALMTYASQLPKANLGISIVSFSESLPTMFGLFIGSYADASRNRSQKMIGSTLLRSLLYFIVGILIGFDASLMILTVIAILNFLSDVIGNYSEALGSPFLPLIVPKNELEEAQGLRGSIAQTVRIAANFLGSALIGILSFRLLAWINSAAFLLTILILLSLRSLFRSLEEKHLQRTEKISMSLFFRQIKTAIMNIIQNRPLFKLLMIFAIVNAIFMTITPSFSMLLAQYPDMVIKNFPFTLALLQGMVAIGSIVGGVIGVNVLKNYTLYQLNPFISILAVLLLSFMYLQETWLILTTFLFLGFLIGVANPKLNAAILTIIPLNQLGTISGGMSMILMSLPPLFILIFSGIVTAFSIQTALICLGMVSLGLLGITYHSRHTTY